MGNDCSSCSGNGKNKDEAFKAGPNGPSGPVPPEIVPPPDTDVERLAPDKAPVPSKSSPKKPAKTTYTITGEKIDTSYEGKVEYPAPSTTTTTRKMRKRRRRMSPRIALPSEPLRLSRPPGPSFCFCLRNARPYVIRGPRPMRRGDRYLPCGAVIDTSLTRTSSARRRARARRRPCPSAAG